MLIVFALCQLAKSGKRAIDKHAATASR